MKTKVLIAAALLVSGAAFSQEATGKQVSVSTSTQVATNVKATKPTQSNDQASAQASVNSNAQASIDNNKVSNDAFVNTKAVASTETTQATIKKVKTASVNKAHQTAATIHETGSAVKTQAKISLQKTGSMVKPVKVNTHMQTRISSVTKLGIH